MSVLGTGEVADLIKTGIEKIWPDKTQAEREQAAMLLASLQGQLDTNKTEAANSSVFVAGWRPAIGWVCGAGLAYTYLLYPLLLWVCAMWCPQVKPPALVVDSVLTELLFAMLGMAGLRSFDKSRGTAK